MAHQADSPFPFSASHYLVTVPLSRSHFPSRDACLARRRRHVGQEKVRLRGNRL